MSQRIWALLGSGEFEPWSAEVDRAVLERADGDGRVLILPTASAREGDEVFVGWGRKGLEHFDSLGVRAEVLPVRTREDARLEEILARVEGASAVYFSGGNPAHLAETLIETPLWDAIRSGMDRGLGYIGCSAGVACLGDIAPDSDAREFDDGLWRPGLGVFPRSWFGPHWDALDSFVPGLSDFIVSSVPGGRRPARDRRADRRRGRRVGLDGRRHVAGPRVPRRRMVASRRGSAVPAATRGARVGWAPWRAPDGRRTGSRARLRSRSARPRS